MKHTSTALVEDIGGRLVSATRAWNRFWFEPADPTMLCLIRVLCGFLTLYVHFAYWYDLQAFFGKDGWRSLALAAELRKEFPWPSQGQDWYPPPMSLDLPAEPRARDDVLKFIKDLPKDPWPPERMLDSIKHPPEMGTDISIPEAVRNMADGDPNDPVLQPRPKLIKFIRELPKEKAERDRILDYMMRWQGFDPRQMAQVGIYDWSIWYHVTDPAWMWVVHGLVMLIMLMFAVGFCTRLTSVLTWLAALSYIHRSPMTLFGCDTMMNILLIYLMIGPSGAALSVDRLISRWWARRQARLAGEPEPEEAPPPKLISANFALRMMQIHFCIIYFAAGSSKILGATWWNGTAIYYTLANYEISQLRYNYSLEITRFLCEQRWLWEILIAGGTWFTLVLELGLPFLVWKPRFRPWCVLGSVMLHTAIALTMGLVVFSLLMAVMVLCFVPGEKVRLAIDWLLRMVRGASAGNATGPGRQKKPRKKDDDADAIPAGKARRKDEIEGEEGLSPS